MAKSHATEDTTPITHTLCGIDITLDVEGWRPTPKTKIDNADPDCKRCLRVIKARYKAQS